MIRRLFTILSAISLLLCVGIAALWVRTYRCSDWMLIRAQDPTYVVITVRGGVEWVDSSRLYRRWIEPRRWQVGSSVGPDVRTWLGFGIGKWFHPDRIGIIINALQVPARVVVIPLWAPLALAAILPALWLTRVRRDRRQRRRHQLGLCLHCGYDLRAHSPGQLCPECGTLIPPTLNRPVAP